MSENYNDDEIIDSSEDTEKKRNKSEKFCFLCRRPIQVNVMLVQPCQTMISLS